MLLEKSLSYKDPITDLPLHRLPQRQPGPGLGFLDGVRVVDLTTSVAGPYATMLLADFGAEVIKIERPGGDDARAWGPPFLDGESLWFMAVNRNKKSVVIDLNDETGMRNLYELIRTADVFLTNQPPSVQKKFDLDYESLRRLNDKLIFTAVTGFGLSGARAKLPCYDLIAEGYSGVMDLTGAEDSEPQKIGAPAADMLAGQDAAMATMAALYDRLQNGKGKLIDVSLVESMTRFLACRISAFVGSGVLPTRSGGTDSVIAIYQAFETQDEPITLGLGSDAIWTRFWTAVGRPEYAEDERVKSNAERRNRRAEIVTEIQAILKQRRRDQWLAIFAEARVPAGPINNIEQTAMDEDFNARGFICALDDGNRLTPHIGLGIQVDGEPVMPRSAAPALGAHTEEVLDSLPSTNAPADSAVSAG